MRRGRGQLFGGRAGGVSASFQRAPSRLHPALPVRGGGARGMPAGRRPLFPWGVPAPCGVSRRSELQVARTGPVTSKEPHTSGRGGKRGVLLIAASELDPGIGMSRI